MSRSHLGFQKLQGRTIFENSHLRRRGVRWWSCDRKGYLRNDLAAIFFAQKKCFAEPSFHLVDRADGRVPPTSSRSHGAELI